MSKSEFEMKENLDETFKALGSYDSKVS